MYKNYYQLSWYNIPIPLLIFAVIGLIATVIAVISICSYKKSDNKAMSAVIAGICALIALFGWMGIFNIVEGEVTYVKKYYSGEYESVTGVVQNYSESGNHRVSYEVEGIKFSNYTSTLAFGYFPSNGGIVNKDGIHVEIKYIPNESGENSIVELNCMEDEVDQSKLTEINYEQIKQTLWVIALIVSLAICIFRKQKSS